MALTAETLKIMRELEELAEIPPIPERELMESPEYIGDYIDWLRGEVDALKAYRNTQP